jgi:hypothetical protein
VIASPENIVAAVAADEMHAAMPNCETSDTGNPNLCLQHCQAGDQSVQTLPHVEVPAFAAISTLVVSEPEQLAPITGITVLYALPERETSPPSLVRFRVLRI